MSVTLDSMTVMKMLFVTILMEVLPAHVRHLSLAMEENAMVNHCSHDRHDLNNWINFLPHKLHIAGIGPLIASTSTIGTTSTSVFYILNSLIDVYIVRPNHQLSYTIGSDFCLEDIDTSQHGVSIGCLLANSPSPPPQFNMTVTRTLTNSRSIEKLFSSQTMDLIVNSSLLSVLFEENTAHLNILCTVSNSFGSVEAMTVIRVCGM